MTESAVASAKRVPQLDGIRAIAILLVLILHCFVRVPNTPDWPVFAVLHRVFSLAYCGVDLFFVLSGFLIGAILLEHRDAGNLYSVFYRRRAFRIIPGYVLLLASFYACRLIPGLSTLNFATYFESPVPLWSYWTFTQNIAMAQVRDLGPYWLTPTWSLGVEEQFYLLMPLLFRLLEVRQLAWFCVLVIIASPALRYAAWQGGANSLAAIFLTPLRSDSLLLGVLCALALRDKSRAATLGARRRWILAATVILGMWIAYLSWRQEAADSRSMVLWGYSAVGFFCAGCLLLSMVSPSSLAVRCLSWRPLTQLGLISYFVYLAHQPVWFVAHWALRGRPPSHITYFGCAVTLLSVGLTIALGALSYRYFEGPLLRVGRQTNYRSFSQTESDQAEPVTCA